VHEAYLRLAGNGTEPHWYSRGHFFAAAAEAMRRLLVEQARRKRRVRPGGGRIRIDLKDLDVEAERGSDDLLALDEALLRLTAEESAAAEGRQAPLLRGAHGRAGRGGTGHLLAHGEPALGLCKGLALPATERAGPWAHDSVPAEQLLPRSTFVSNAPASVRRRTGGCLLAQKRM
jgi:hypothetical protein